jgi:hypothetical protein
VRDHGETRFVHWGWNGSIGSYQRSPCKVIPIWIPSTHVNESLDLIAPVSSLHRLPTRPLLPVKDDFYVFRASQRRILHAA